MDLIKFTIPIIILIFAIFSIATSSIAIECYNQSPLKENKTGNYNFIIINLVFSIILALLSIRNMYITYSS
jgi:hypothetical protein